MNRRYKISKSAQQRALDFIDLLQDKFPKAFPKKPEPKVPLMIGIHEQLFLLKDELGVEEKTILNAMKLWCKGARYYTALSVAGVPRVNLNGDYVGSVTEKETIGHRIKFAPPVINRKIEDLELSVRTYNLLKRAKIQFESDIKERIDSLNEIMGMGKKSLEEIKLALK